MWELEGVIEERFSWEGRENTRKQIHTNKMMERRREGEDMMEMDRMARKAIK